MNDRRRNPPWKVITGSVSATRFLLLLAYCIFLVACGSSSAPQASVTTTVPSPTSSSLTTIAQLQEQLVTDEVLVTSIQHDAGPPPTLTIDYQFNDRTIANTKLDIISAINVETERAVEAITKRVVALVEAGTPIDTVVLQRHMGGGPADITRIAVNDMRAWSAGQINTDEYRMRRSNNSGSNSAPSNGYPSPDGATSRTYPAPNERLDGAYPTPSP